MSTAPPAHQSFVPGPIISHSRPLIDADDIRAVTEVLTSGQLAQAEKVREFELRTAEQLSQRDGVAVSSGTAALHLALLAAGIRPGDAVALPSYACAALLHSAEYVGAKPILVDIDPGGFNLNSEDLRRKSASAPDGVKAVIVPHMFGTICSIAAVRDAAGDDAVIIEDATHAIGNPAVGGGDLVVVSFYATKMLTTGEGGMVLGRSLATLGTVRDRREYDGKPTHAMRFNYKITEMQGALGLSQLKKLPFFISRRRELTRRYGRPEQTCYRFVVAVPDRLRVLEEFEALGIQARTPVFMPLHQLLHKAESGFPETIRAMDRYVSIPLYPALSEDEVKRILAAKRGILGK